MSTVSEIILSEEEKTFMESRRGLRNNLEVYISKGKLNILRYCLEVKGEWAGNIYNMAILRNKAEILDYLLTFKPTGHIGPFHVSLAQVRKSREIVKVLIKHNLVFPPECFEYLYGKKRFDIIRNIHDLEIEAYGCMKHYYPVEMTEALSHNEPDLVRYFFLHECSYNAKKLYKTAVSKNNGNYLRLILNDPKVSDKAKAPLLMYMASLEFCWF